jgi:hypothetical protein
VEDLDGMVIIDVVDRKIVNVEVLFRDEIGSQLDALGVPSVRR